MSRKPEASRVFACAAIVSGASPGEARHCFFGDETVLRPGDGDTTSDARRSPRARGGVQVLTVTARDLQYRYRRFLIGVLITALVFGVAFIFDGVKNAVRNEATRIVDVFGADAWVVTADSPGSFLSTKVVPASLSQQVASSPVVERAAPVIVGRSTLPLHSPLDVNLVGHVPGDLGAPPVTEGHEVRRPGEMVVGSGVDLDIGDRLDLSGVRVRVVGRADGLR